MADKKQNDIDNWKGMLDSPESLPGEGMSDKNAAWEKLYGRLHASPAPRTAWYWIAAAVLIMITVSWLITGREKNHITKAALPVIKDTKSIQTLQPANLGKQTVVAAMALTKQPTARAIDAAHKKLSYGNAGSFYTSQVIAASISTVENKPAATIAVPLTDDSAKVVLISATKKKLRVLHVNELETITPSASEQLALAAQEKSNTKFRLKNNASGNLSTPGRQEDTGIRIPLTN